jgi:sulfite reductase alpha subunit-like flavoprotein
MAKDIYERLNSVLIDAGGLSKEESQALLSQKVKDKEYVMDIWT